jgi:Kef-type K+ transport system membrane component KefB
MWLLLPASPMKSVQAMAVGVALSISAVPVAIEILREHRLLHHRIGRTVVSAAIFDDVLGLLALTVLIALINTHALPEPSALAMLLAKAGLFFAIAIAASMFFYRFVSPILHVAQSAIVAMSAMVLGALALSVIAEALGLHFLLGPFMVGLFFEKSRVGRRIFRQTGGAVELVGQGFFVPIFFAVVGAQLDVAAFADIPGMIALLIFVAIAGKMLGAGLPAMAAGMKRRDALAVGSAMSARGMFDGAAAAGGRIANLYSALVVTAVVTTVAAPILLRWLLAGKNGKPPDSQPHPTSRKRSSSGAAAGRNPSSTR